jgi:hypothetical protein
MLENIAAHTGALNLVDCAWKFLGSILSCFRFLFQEVKDVGDPAGNSCVDTFGGATTAQALRNLHLSLEVEFFPHGTHSLCRWGEQNPLQPRVVVLLGCCLFLNVFGPMIPLPAENIPRVIEARASGGKDSINEAKI